MKCGKPFFMAASVFQDASRISGSILCTVKLVEARVIGSELYDLSFRDNKVFF